jgi:hypothetical protein
MWFAHSLSVQSQRHHTASVQSAQGTFSFHGELWSRILLTFISWVASKSP